MAWKMLFVLVLISAVLCAVGFYKYVYFMSIGYGFSVAGIGVALLLFSLSGTFNLQTANWQQIMLSLLLLAYGLRLSGFLLYREYKNAAYRKTLKKVSGEESDIPFLVKVAIWVGVFILYVAQTSPVIYNFSNQSGLNVCGGIGIGVGIVALVIESLADLQKMNQKKENPDMVAMKGLYRMVRCPNYFGEMLFWTGIILSGIQALTGAGQWCLAIAGYICIIGVMFSGAKRLEKRQMKRYGSNPVYQEYAEHTPILLPFVPLYHLNGTIRREVTN